MNNGKNNQSYYNIVDKTKIREASARRAGTKTATWKEKKASGLFDHHTNESTLLSFPNY